MTSPLSKSAITLLLVIMTLGSVASAESCRYQKRVDDFYFQSLPEEIMGWFTCDADDPSPSNLIYVAKTKKLEKIALKKWFENFQTTLNPAPAQIVVLKSSDLSDKLQSMWLESRREAGATRYLLIVKPTARNEQLMYIQSANVSPDAVPFTVPETLRRIIGRPDPQF